MSFAMVVCLAVSVALILGLTLQVLSAHGRWR